MTYILWASIIILAAALGWGMCALLMSGKIADLDVGIALLNEQNKTEREEGYKIGWEECALSAKVLMQKKRSAGGKLDES